MRVPIVLVAAFLTTSAIAGDWEGVYIGLNAGGAWGDSDLTTSTVDSTADYFAASSVTSINANGPGSVEPNGFTGGGQIGVNVPIGNVVFGLEADFESFQNDETRTVGPIVYPCCAPRTYTIVQNVSTDWLLTLRGRMGWAFDNWLIYATGGVAVTRLETSFSFSDTYAATTASGSESSTISGWTAGGGAEVKLTPNWSIRAEYLYLDFSSQSLQSTNLTSGGGTAFPENEFSHSAELQSSIVRAGVNYGF